MSEVADPKVHVGHVFNEFCPRGSTLRYWPVKNPYIRSSVYCFRRTNEKLFPHVDVCEERIAQRLRRAPAGVWKPVTRLMASAAHRRSWHGYLRTRQPQILHAQFGDKAVRQLEMFNRTELPLVVTFRGSDINCAPWNADYRLRLRRLFERAALCHFVSHDLRNKATRLGCPEEKAKAIHVGAPEVAEPVEVSDRSEDCRFYMVASFVPCKGHETLFDAFQQVRQQLRDSQLHLIGNGPLRDRLAWVIEERGLKDAVVLHGQMEHSDVIETLRKDADVVVLASQQDDAGCQEGLPTSLQEAASMGVPCIGTDCGGIGELIVCGQTGTVVPQRAADDLASAMVELGSKPALRRRMGLAAFERSAKLFNLDRFYRLIAEQYEALAGVTNSMLHGPAGDTLTPRLVEAGA